MIKKSYPDIAKREWGAFYTGFFFYETELNAIIEALEQSSNPEAVGVLEHIRDLISCTEEIDE